MEYVEQKLTYMDDESEYPENGRFDQETKDRIFDDPRAYMDQYVFEKSGITSSFHHKWHTTPNPEPVAPGARMQRVIEAQWTDCPKEVEDVVRKLWRFNELGNNNYFLSESIFSLLELWTAGYRVDFDYEDRDIDTRPLIAYILESFPDIEPEDEVWIHWWW